MGPGVASSPRLRFELPRGAVVGPVFEQTAILRIWRCAPTAELRSIRLTCYTPSNRADGGRAARRARATHGDVT